MHTPNKDPLVFLHGLSVEVASRLLGCILERSIDGAVLRARIVETEAYDQTDVASHSFKGETPRTKVMFGPPGRLYVYFTYGMHYCSNVVVGEVGHGAAVLLRALEPLEGLDVMVARRGKPEAEVTNGPAKLCQAFGIDKTWNGHDLHREPLRLTVRPPIDQQDIVQTTRVGISQGSDLPWRFYIRNNRYVSKT